MMGLWSNADFALYIVSTRQEKAWEHHTEAIGRLRLAAPFSYKERIRSQPSFVGNARMRLASVSA